MKRLAVLLMVLSAHAAGAQPPFFGLVLDGLPITAERLREEERVTGAPAAIVTIFLQWPSPGAPGAPFPASSMEAIRASGALPCLTWEPMRIEAGHEVAVRASDVLAGREDAYLAEFGRQAAAWGHPFLLRFAHEMNLERYHWGTDRAGYGPGSPELYRRMWAHVRARVHAAGATRALWTFCPNVDSLPAQPWNDAAAYYPGDALVDVLGMDGYNWGTTRTEKVDGWTSQWRSFAEIFGPLRGKLRALAPAKPLLVGETATALQGGDKAAWIAGAMETARAWGLAGVCWFQVNKETDWRIGAGIGARQVPHLPRGRGAIEWFEGQRSGR